MTRKSDYRGYFGQSRKKQISAKHRKKKIIFKALKKVEEGTVCRIHTFFENFLRDGRTMSFAIPLIQYVRAAMAVNISISRYLHT